jgi:methionyl-tRNA formyltransferase
VPLIEALPHGFVNVHFSLLPRWRGAAPVERAILAGDAETGVCLMQIEAGLDTGPVFACERTPIGAQESAGELRERLVTMGTRLLVDELPSVPGATPVPQSGEPTHADKLAVADFRLDFTRPSAELVRVVRAGNPRPGAWFASNGKRVKVWRAHASSEAPARGALVTGDGTLVLDEVQPEGKRPMDAQAWLAGLHGDVVVDPA